MHPGRFTRLLLRPIFSSFLPLVFLIAGLVFAPPGAFAQTATSSIMLDDIASETYEQAATPAPTSYSGPAMQGASCGPIGPQEIDTQGAVNIELLGTDEKREQLPLVPTLLLGTLAVTAVAWGVRMVVQKKRASLWVLGLLAASLVMIAGFVWNLFGGTIAMNSSILQQAVPEAATADTL